jgi:hypothetical protein
MKRAALLLPALIAGLIIGGLIVASLRVGDWFRGPDPETIASASLQSVREQARLTAFSARYVAVVTSTQRRFGLSAQKTLIMPGTVRYELDLARLRQRDMAWNDTTKTLSISLPGLEISQPEIDMNEVKEYGSGGLLGAISNAEEVLETSNRQAAQAELRRQAQQAMPMRLARDAARRAMERSFAMPLKAAGIDATVTVRFRDEAGRDPTQLDRSRRMEDVLRERQGAK